MKNQKYKKLEAYLSEILHRLQNQSDLLRFKDIAICITSEKTKNNNAEYNFPSDTIILGLAYLKKYAKKGEDAVAAIISHELSHNIFREKYSISGGKEEEIFADNYGLILCKKAGYNTNISLWEKSLSANINDDVHPQHKIRQLIMQRTSRNLGENEVPIKLFKEIIPDEPLDEYYHDLLNQRKKHKTAVSPVVHLATDIMANNEIEVSSHNHVKYLLSLNNLSKEHKFSIQRLNLENCTNEDTIALFNKLRQSPALFNDESLLKKFRDGFIKQKILMDDNSLSSDILQQLDSHFIYRLEKMTSFDEQLNATEQFMNIEHRCSQEKDRQKINIIYANALKNIYRTDNGSADYVKNLEQKLNKLSGKIHNADVLPLAKTLKDILNISSEHIYVLQNFVKQNSFELQQIRTETLITECLLNSNQALQTVNYLISNDIPAFHFKGIYDKSLSKNQYSYIDTEMLKSIHDDWATIAPNKRADLFILLMENIPTENASKKLSMFIDKTAEKNDIFKPIVDMYLNTYPAKQQNSVVATIVSHKKLDKHLDYEECFKIILQNSGIVGHNVYDMLYQTKSSETIQSLHRNYEPLYSEGEIIYANLFKLGKILSQSSNKNQQELGKYINKSISSHKISKRYQSTR